MKKPISFSGFNEAEIVKINADSILCKINEIDADGNIVKSDSNISFPIDNLPFALSSVEMSFLDGSLDEAYVLELTVAELDELGILLGIELSGLKADKQQQILEALNIG